MIFKIPVKSLIPSKVDELPELAVTFGDMFGDILAKALTVDQYGYIYIHGVATTNTFGGTTDTTSWIHAKTHWEMTYELQCDRNSLTVNALGLC